MLLELKNITKTNEFNNISYSIDNEEIVYTNNKYIIPSIVKLIRLDEGSISLFNRDDKKSFIKSIESVGYKSTLRIKNKKQTTLEYLIYCNSFYNANYIDNINYLLNMFNLDKDKLLINLNLYEQNKLSLIQALFYEPKLILLEEPFKDIDYETKLNLINYLYELKKNGSSILYYSRNLDLNLICDKALLIFNKELYDLDINIIKSYKRVTIKIDYDDLKKIENLNIYKLTKSDVFVSFITNDKINDILKKIEYYNPLDIYITNPSIEEIKEIYEEKTNL